MENSPARFSAIHRTLGTRSASTLYTDSGTEETWKAGEKQSSMFL